MKHNIKNTDLKRIISICIKRDISHKYLSLLFLFFLFSFNIKSQIYINEIMPSNITILMDDIYEYPDSWVELYNAGDEDVDIYDYSFSDDSKTIKKWVLKEHVVIPAKGYKLLYFDKEGYGLHASFRLDIGGATLSMYDPSGVLVNKFKYKKDIFNTSFGRVPDGGSEIFTLTEATPGNTNNNTETATERCASPEISFDGNFYSGLIRIKVSCPTPGAKIYYSSNGTEPSRLSSVVPEGGELLVNSVRTFKFKSSAEGFLDSPTLTRTFFIGLRQIDIPIVSISTNPKNMTDNKIGIYVKGTNGRIANCESDPRNYNQPWRRPINIEIFESSHVDAPIINQTAEMRIAGGCSRNNDQKSLIVYGNKRFGTKRFDYDFFREKPGMEIKSFMLRNTGNDYYSARLRDAYIQSLIAGNANIDYQAYQPAILYINGAYYGIQNLRERTNEDYVLSNYGLEEDEIDLISLEASDAYVSVGNNVAYNQMIDFARRNDISQDENYKVLADQIDIEEYINYMFIEIFAGNRDWPGNNCKLWRPRKDGGKWRWILMDTDFGFGLYGESSTHNTLLYAMGQLSSDYWMNPEWSTVLFSNMMENEGFRNKFINRTMTALGDFLQEDNINRTADSLVNTIYNESPYHSNRWGLRNVDSWKAEVSNMKSWPIRRSPRMINFLRNRYNLDATIPVKVSTNLPNGNSNNIKLNEYLLSQYDFDGNMISGEKLLFEALDVFGYDFDYWEITRVTNNSTLTNKNTSPSYLTTTSNSIKSLNLIAHYKENALLSLNKTDDENNFNIMSLSDGVRINYNNSTATSMNISLYTMDGMLVDNVNYPEKETSFSILFDYPDNLAKVYILKCKTDSGSYTFKIMK